MTDLSIEALDAARRDPVLFADVVLGAPLWDHQVEVARSEALYRVMCAGRRSGKTRVFGVLALHRAFSVPGSKVLILSACEDAAATAFDDMAKLIRESEVLKSSVVDDFARSMTLSNGSRIRCVPSSTRQVRSQEADLLIVDEAGWVAAEIWQAVQPITLARPGARIIMSSSPWGGPGHFFHDYWKRGMDSPSREVESWHWTATVSPLIDAEQLEIARQMESPWSFAREYLAEWADAEGSYFTEAELSGAVADYELVAPEVAAERWGEWLDGPGWVPEAEAVAGVDWGFNRDANAVAVLAALDDRGLNDGRFGEGRRALFVPWLSARHGLGYGEFIDEMVAVTRGYQLQVVASERNGVGAYPTQELQSRMATERCSRPGVVAWVRPVWTDARRKMSGFSKIKGLLQEGLLVLPNHPELLKQLRALEFQNTESGLTKIAVPERSGHDDLAMALLQAVSCVHPRQGPQWSLGSLLDGNESLRAASQAYRSSVRKSQAALAAGEVEHMATPSGVVVPMPAAPMAAGESVRWWTLPEGDESSDGW